MIPELGHFSLILALFMAITQVMGPVLAVWDTASERTKVWNLLTRSSSWGQFLFVSLSFCCLAYAFVTDDFSVAYVAQNSNTQLPTIYKFCAIWGAHEGSILLWILILNLWTLAVSVKERWVGLNIQAPILGIMGLISIGFLLFTVLTSNPFLRLLLQTPVEGRDLNPLLQDPGMVIHPPVLYMGYVGFSVIFAFTITALLKKELNATWANAMRPWASTAWAFLTIGIALGSWWAYYELGWGGWWFWDPVENASFMPWLVGTALIHSLIMVEKRNVFKAWTLLLGILVFSLSLLGTFLVRSGVLTSVHAFANDPQRGLFILGFLTLVIISSLLLYATRVNSLTNKEEGYGFLSRETFLLANNIILIIAAAIILLGTLYPLFIDALGLGKLSVGPPYFNTFFIPLMTVLAAFMALAPLMRWQNTASSQFIKPLIVGIIVAGTLAESLLLLFANEFRWLALLGCFLAVLILSIVAYDTWLKMRRTPSPGYKKMQLSHYTMAIAHLGFAITFIGVCLTTLYSVEKDVRMAPAELLQLGSYQFKFIDITQQQGPNYYSDTAKVEVYHTGKKVLDLHPEKRRYWAQDSVMTEAAIDAGLWRDLYVALGEPIDAEQGVWAVRIYYKPFIRWIWLGAILMALSGAISALGQRYKAVST